MKRSYRGFTIIEVILVLGIIGILLSITIPNFQKPLAHYQLRSTTMQMAADLRWVRQQSIYGRAGIVKFWVLQKDRQYLIVEGNRIVLRRPLAPGIEFQTVILDRNPLTFTPTGAPSEGGRVVLKNSYGDLGYVYFMPSTGRVRVDYEAAGRR